MKKLLLLSAFLFLCIISVYSQCSVQGVYIHAFMADPSGTNNFDTDGNGSAGNRDEFVQICSDTNVAISLNGFTLDDIVNTRYTFASTDSIQAGECITIITDWINTSPGLPSNFREMGSGPVWNDGGDSIILTNGTNKCDVSYGSAGSVPEMDGCPTVFTNGTAYTDCNLDSADITIFPLPVELVDFRAIAADGSVKLSWKTAQEVNNGYFTIERSTDGGKFQIIGIEEGQGNNQGLQDYVFVDDQPSISNFYRLKQTDFDGSSSYSNVIRISFENKRISVSQLGDIVHLNSTGDDLVEFAIINSVGMQVYAGSLDQHIEISKSEMGSGFFILSANVDGHIVNKRFFVN